MKSEMDQFGPHLVILSAERTLLSWLRLSVTLMSLGFILDRFGIYIRSQGVSTISEWFPKTYTSWMGTGLVIAGSVTSIAAGIIYTHFRAGYSQKDYYGPKRSIVLSMILSVLIMLIGVVTAFFLITITD